MLILATVCFAVGGLSLVTSLLFFILHLIFEYKPEKLGKSRGFIKNTKQKTTFPCTKEALRKLRGTCR